MISLKGFALTHNWKHVGENCVTLQFSVSAAWTTLPNSLWLWVATLVGGDDLGWQLLILLVDGSLPLGFGSKQILFLCGKLNVGTHPSWNIPRRQ